MACGSCKSGFHLIHVNNLISSAILMSWVALAEGCIASTTTRCRQMFTKPCWSAARGPSALLLSGPFVKGDVMLAQKIAPETDEKSALAVANIFSA